MRRPALKMSLPPELHTWEGSISVTTRTQVVNELNKLFQTGQIAGFCVRTLFEISGGETRNVRIHPIRDLDDLLTQVEGYARVLDNHHHYQILVHEAPQRPDTDTGSNTERPRLATVVCEQAGESLPAARA